jgi:hypothetical protein
VTQATISKLTWENGNEVYLHLGPNTTRKDLDEAMFVRARSSTSYRDILRYRELLSKDEFKDGDWSKVVGDDDLVVHKQMSPAGK